jgi:hypothetical protein
MTASISGCLLSGQLILFSDFDVGETSDTAVNKYLVDLNDEEDYADNKDKIESVDGVAIIAVIENLTSTPVKGTIYVSNDPDLTTVSQVEAEADLVFISPEVPGNGEIKIGWMDGFAHMVDPQPIIDEVLGDGTFWIYAIADDTPFNLDIVGAVAITMTVSN